MATKVWAHRGASGYAPENTIPAFKLAVEQKADGVELDVHLSSDGKLMVIHDETVDRTSNGTGRVVDMTCQELKKLDFSNGMPGYKDVRIPTLKEVYGLLKNTNLTINVEIKCDVVIYYGIWDKVIELEREMGMQGRIIYSSFNHYVLMKLREVDPKAKIGLLYSEAMVDPWVYANYLHADAIHPHYLAALGCPGLIEGCKKAGVEIHPWTCNDEQVVCDLASAGIEAVITNYPDKAREAIENRSTRDIRIPPRKRRSPFMLNYGRIKDDCHHQERFYNKVRHTAPKRACGGAAFNNSIRKRIPRRKRPARAGRLFAYMAHMGLQRGKGGALVANGEAAAPWREQAHGRVCHALAVQAEPDRAFLCKA